MDLLGLTADLHIIIMIMIINDNHNVNEHHLLNQLAIVRRGFDAYVEFTQ